MAADGLGADPQMFCDLVGGLAGAERRQHLTLPGGQNQLATGAFDVGGVGCLIGFDNLREQVHYLSFGVMRMDRAVIAEAARLSSAAHPPGVSHGNDPDMSEIVRVVAKLPGTHLVTVLYHHIGFVIMVMWQKGD